MPLKDADLGLGYVPLKDAGLGLGYAPLKDAGLGLVYAPEGRKISNLILGCFLKINEITIRYCLVKNPHVIGSFLTRIEIRIVAPRSAETNIVSIWENVKVGNLIQIKILLVNVQDSQSSLKKLLHN